MDDLIDVPEEVKDAGALIKTLLAKPLLTKAEKELVNQAKLKIAYWACGQERIASTRDNLSFVLGSDAKEIMANYDKALEREEEKSKSADQAKPKKGKPGDKSEFWNGA